MENSFKSCPQKMGLSWGPQHRHTDTRDVGLLRGLMTNKCWSFTVGNKVGLPHQVMRAAGHLTDCNNTIIELSDVADQTVKVLAICLIFRFDQMGHLD